MAFQSDAFQSDAFQQPTPAPTPAPSDTGGTDLKRKYPRYQWRDHNKEEEEELKLSQLLAQQLAEQIRKNQALMAATAQANKNISPIVDQVANLTPSQPAPPPMDAAKKAELLKRLELARQAKEAKRRAAEDFAKQRLRNLAKARRVKAKNRK
jgi:hypothetical protein